MSLDVPSHITKNDSKEGGPTMSGHRSKLLTVVSVFALALLAFGVQPSSAAIWSNTELHIQYGTLDVPSFDDLNLPESVPLLAKERHVDDVSDSKRDAGRQPGVFEVRHHRARALSHRACAPVQALLFNRDLA